MHIEHRISTLDFVCAIAETIDLISPLIANHHKKVAHISSGIALEMKLPADEIQDIVMAALLHDIGAFSIQERLNTLSFDLDNAGVYRHALQGYKLLESFEPFSKAAAIIKHHHAAYNSKRSDIPIGSYIIHVADRVSILFDEKSDILKQIPVVLECVSGKQDYFHPEALSAFRKIADIDYLWLETFSPTSGICPSRKTCFTAEIVELETLRDFAKIVAQIIDFRSRFTATHSSGVAATAIELSKLSGFSDRECKLMEIAGLLHDLGKLTISNDILEKPAALSRDDMYLMKKHTYYTYVILSKIPGMEQLAMWAAHHHERPDGNGYPFHIKDGDFSKLSRIIAVADIVTALTEDRPYRLGMEEGKVREIMTSMTKKGGVDKDISGLAMENYTHLNGVRTEAQNIAKTKYETFSKTMII